MMDNPVQTPAGGAGGALGSQLEANTPSTSSTIPAQGGSTFIKPSIHPPSQFNVSARDVAEEWKMWKQMWDNYAVLTNLFSQPESYQTALLLHSIGPDGVRIYNGMKFVDEEESKNSSVILTKFGLHFLGERREFFERFKFNQRNQEGGESVDQYVTVLRTMSKSCGFCSCMKDKLLMDRILLGVRDDRMRERMMATQDLDLTKAIDICKAVEATTTQMKAMKKEELVHRVSRKNFSKKPRNQQKGASKPKQKETEKGKVDSEPKKCKFCCRLHPLRKEKCPAWGQTCSACHSKNHFKVSKVCRANKVHGVLENEYASDTSSCESISTVWDVNAVQTDRGPVFCIMKLHDQRIKFQIDSGSTVNLLPRKYLSSTDVICPEAIHLHMWNKSSSQAIGKCKVKTVNPVTDQKYKVDYVIVEEDHIPLISKKAAEQMKLITFNYDSFEQVNAASTIDFVKEYPDVFSTSQTGILPGTPVHLTVNKDTQPIIRPARTVPESLKEAVKGKLDRLKEQGIIEEVDDPSDWVSQMSVTQKKSGDVRICIDPRPLNEALKREHYTLPVLDDILPCLTKATTFSICDLKDGYLHCPLDDESSKLTTFATPWGRYKWKRLPFGLKVSSEIFQKRLHQALDGLEGVRCVADDIIVWGDDITEHDRRLHQLLQRCRNIGMILNKEKSRLYVQEVPFLGHIVTDKGLKPDPSKIEAILKMPTPETRDDINRLRGMVNYLGRFLPSLSSVMAPINDLTRKDVEWSWDATHDKAFQEIKKLLTTAPVLAYFDQSKNLEIYTDACAHGIGAALLQEGRPIAYASRALSDTEMRYAVIEKEMLAIVYALEKWNQFTYGRPVKVYSDHKPLESIMKKALDKAPKRLQGMLLRAAAYDVVVQYLKGKDNHLADPLSRSHMPYQMGQQDLEAINSLQDLSLPADQVESIRRATTNDESLQALKDVILGGWPDHRSQVPPLATPYFGVRDELSTAQGLIFRGERLVIPKTMRQKIKENLHLGHNGIDATLRQAREHVYWPGMNQEIKEWIATCETCQENAISQAPQPMMPHLIPDRPWAKIGIDLFHHNNDNYLVMVCYFSNFFEIAKLGRTTAEPVIKKLKQNFGRYGIPDTIVSDNGPPFSSQEFANFNREWGISHKTTSPYNSKANGKAESAVKTAKRLLRKCNSTGQDVNMALLSIRNTPTQGINSSPAQRFLGRRTKTLLPTTESSLKPRGHTTSDLDSLHKMQERQSKYFDRHTKTLPDLQEGSVVRMKPFNTNDKKWRRATVVKRLDQRAYEVERNGVTHIRNREHLRACTSVKPDREVYIPAYTEIPDRRDDDHRTQTEVPLHHTRSDVDAPPGLDPDVPPTLSESPRTKSQVSLRRSSRTRREPTRLKDFVTN